MKLKSLADWVSASDTTMRHSLQQLAAMPTTLLHDVLGTDSDMWFKLIEHDRDLCPDYEGWLKEHALSRTPASAARYYSSCVRSARGGAYLAAAYHSSERCDTESRRAQFLLGLKERMALYRGKPYKDRLVAGDYVCLLPAAASKSSPVGAEDVGLILDICLDTDGEPVSYLVAKEDGTQLNLPVGQTSRIY